MTAQTIARLDRTKAPPGYWLGVLAYEEGYFPTCKAPAGHPSWRGEMVGEVVAAAWEYYQRANDPPGMWSLGGGWEGGFGLAGVSALRGGRWDGAQARAAAWAWYWKRREVADKLDDARQETAEGAETPLSEGRLSFEGDPPIELAAVDAWPRCLAWPDEQVSAVERWLTDGGELPEVLSA